MTKSRCPSFTSLPSVKSRFWTIPFTRARTSATRNAEVRPGSSFVSVTAVGASVTTPTSTGPEAAGAAFLLQPASRASPRARRVEDLVLIRRFP